jgi:hypothetical protein
MQSLSNAHGDTFETKQANHAATDGCYNILEHCPESEVFGEYSSQFFICCWVCESLSGGAARGSAYNGEVDSPLCSGQQQLGLWFGQKKENHAMLTGFSDANFTGDVDARKCTIRVIFFLVNSPIT